MQHKSFINQIKAIANEFNMTSCIDYLADLFFVKEENAGDIVSYFVPIFNASKGFITSISEAANYYLYSILILDRIMDTKEELHKEALLFSYVLREHSLKIMYKLFPASSIFWNYFDKYYKEYVCANTLEIKINNNLNKKISIRQMEHLYSGNSAMAKAVHTALAIKYKNSDIIAPLSKSFDYYYIAFNLLDDVNDWKEDCKNKQFSYLLSKTISDNDLDPSILNNPSKLGKYIFFSGAALNVLDMSIEYYSKSLNAVDGIECLNWKKALNVSINKCMSLREDLNMLINKQLISIGELRLITRKAPEIKINKDLKFTQIYKYGLNYIKEKWEDNFIEAAAFTYFPHSIEFDSHNRYYIGDVFQRAVICDILFDINKRLKNELGQILKSEADYLLAKQCKGGMWNFYNDFSLHPCDIDTSSQVMLFLIKMNLSEKISKATIESFDNIICHSGQDGSIGSWNIPPEEKCTSIQLQQLNFFRKYVNHDVYNSKEVEVMANLLLCLNSIDNKKYQEVISNGINFIEKNQEYDGSWKSKWYWGNYYSTYKCSALFSKLKPQSKSLPKALNYIFKTQNEDGGWGFRENISDPLNTAYALISIYNLKYCIDLEISNIINRAFNYISKAIIDPEQMKLSDFINYNRLKNSAFRSNSITMAYIIKATDCWEIEHS